MHAEAAAACRMDLEALPAFLLENDAGAAAHLASRGAAALESALVAARAAAADVDSDEQALNVLRRYLAAWRPAHLGLSSAGRSPIADTTDRAPRLASCSAGTVVWTLPSFAPHQRAPLLRLLETQRGLLESHPHWIIDVRGNSGGADHAYEPLLVWLMDNAWCGVGVEFLATPANIAAQRAVLAHVPADDTQSRVLIDEIVATLRAADSGEWVRLKSEMGAIVQHAPETATLRRPECVVVLIDRHCGSSGEQFLLDVRQSRRVKLMGQPTAGALDYSNLRPHPLPSRRHVLWYATSRSLRLPHHRIDGVGVTPDVYLPPPRDDTERAAEILAAQRFLDSRA